MPSSVLKGIETRDDTSSGCRRTPLSIRLCGRFEVAKNPTLFTENEQGTAYDRLICSPCRGLPSGEALGPGQVPQHKGKPLHEGPGMRRPAKEEYASLGRAPAKGRFFFCPEPHSLRKFGASFLGISCAGNPKRPVSASSVGDPDSNYQSRIPAYMPGFWGGVVTLVTPPRSRVSRQQEKQKPPEYRNSGILSVRV